MKNRKPLIKIESQRSLISLKNAMTAQRLRSLHIVDYNNNLRYSSVIEEGLIRT